VGGRYAVLQYVIAFIAEQPVGDRIKVSGRGYVLTIPSDSLKVALSKVYHLGGGTKSLGVSRQRVNNKVNELPKLVKKLKWPSTFLRATCVKYLVSQNQYNQNPEVHPVGRDKGMPNCWSIN
jgi:hypothetical protein